MLSETSTTVNADSARKFGHKVAMPLPFTMAPREICPKCWIGLNCATGCSHFGIASTGVNAPESEVSGGFTKKRVSCACRADFVNVAMKVPMLMPHNKQRAAAETTKNTF